MTNIFIAGCPRSGTTVVAKIFSDLGWDCGDRVRKVENRMEDSIFQKINLQTFASNDMASWNAQFPILFALNDKALMEILEDKEEPWLIKEPMLLMNWPTYRLTFPDSRLVVTIREPSQAVGALMKFTGFPILRAMRIYWRQMNLAYMWSELFGDVHFIDFPSLAGLEQAITAAGGCYDENVVQEHFNAESVNRYPAIQDFKGFDAFGLLYDKLLGKTGREYADQRRECSV